MRRTRSIIEIDQDLCDGCKVCLHVCAEAALELDASGKARLVGEALCDGLGACLDVCPTGALKIVKREAEAFDEAAVHATTSHKAPSPPPPTPRFSLRPAAVDHVGCPGSRERRLAPKALSQTSGKAPSELSQWPVQLHLVSPGMARFADCDLLVAADCTAFALGSFHAELLRGKALAVACPKLDRTQDYLEKLTEILAQNRVRSLTVAIMEVPCCQGLRRLVEEAAARSGTGLAATTVVVPIGG
jgi:ferredoxin